MKKIFILTLCICILLIGCTPTNQTDNKTDLLNGDLILKDQISPNKEYVTEEKDIVYYTVEIYQNENNTITVNTFSNSGFFKPIQYTLDFDKPITEDDIEIKWTTLMGNPDPSEDDQLAIADIVLKSEGNTFSERKVNFVNGGIEIFFDALDKNMK